jgi:hypothetical protein
MAALYGSRDRWIQFCEWGVDDICTDSPEELERTLAAVSCGVAL